MDHEISRRSHVTSPHVAALGDSITHQLLIAAVVPRMSADCVLSHVSAAVMLELPLWDVDLSVVHVTRNRSSGGRKRTKVVVHCSPFDENSTTNAGRFVVMGLCRTVIDLARTLPYEQSVMIIEFVLAEGLLGRDDLVEELDRAKRTRGCALARRALDTSSSRSESVGETQSRLLFKNFPFPQPQQQGDVFDHKGNFLGRTDFYWEKLSLLGEFDGMAKYGKLLKVGQDSGQAVFREKVREDSMRDAGFHVVRWIWDDLREPEILREKIELAMERGKRLGKPVGSVRKARCVKGVRED